MISIFSGYWVSYPKVFVHSNQPLMVAVLKFLEMLLQFLPSFPERQSDQRLLGRSRHVSGAVSWTRSQLNNSCIWNNMWKLHIFITYENSMNNWICSIFFKFRLDLKWQIKNHCEQPISCLAYAWFPSLEVEKIKEKHLHLGQMGQAMDIPSEGCRGNINMFNMGV